MLIEITGRLASGLGLGRHFTRLDWARAQFIAKLSIDPFPGTVNAIVEDAAMIDLWQRVAAGPGIRIPNPGSGPHDCDARCYLATIENRIEAAIVLPEVDTYPSNQIELIAQANVREALGIADGDRIRLAIRD